MNRKEEAASAKLWAVYVSEAEKYDRALVESWKSDMEGLLIFAALFSSILTAFIIESYQSLNPDSGDLTVHLLVQISQQLAASANGTAFTVPPPTTFSPNVSSIICNALWFTSLGFSLACALVATFVQQWSRDFLHKTDMHSAPAIRARIFSYLYYGLKRFQMHTVVEIIPLLLHGSLILFFGGLVAFLIPVNLAMTVIAATVLGIVAAVYSSLSLLPLYYLDCPYHTPLSGAFWTVLRIFPLWNCRNSQSDATKVETGLEEAGDGEHPDPNETMIEAMSRKALETRSERDYKALVWTMKSLADDVELEPFVEAIADLLYPRRYTYEGHIRGLIQHPDLQLLKRLADLLNGCHSGIMSPEAAQRREATCYKACWAIASLSCHQPNDRGEHNPLDLGLFTRYMRFEPQSSDIAPYRISTMALVAWSTYLAIQVDLNRLRANLVAHESNLGSKVGDLESKQMTHSLSEILSSCIAAKRIIRVQMEQQPTTQDDIFRCLSWVEKFLSHAPYQILFDFLCRSVSSPCVPYQWEETRSLLRVSGLVPLPTMEIMKREIGGIVSAAFHSARDDAERLWVLGSISDALSVWAAIKNRSVDAGIIGLLAASDSDQALRTMLLAKEDVEIHLWDCFPAIIFDAVSGSFRMVETTFSALWRFASIGLRYQDYNPDSIVSSLETLLKILSIPESPFPWVTQSIIALLRVALLRDHNLPRFKTRTEMNLKVLPRQTPYTSRPEDDMSPRRGQQSESINSTS
ncbi:hypothetical protein DFH06DRAFT_520443 [Mycena polygramma]|nr:hypothetical protein DFH06DRAFT_520443 [Mycena polygramma]